MGRGPRSLPVSMADGRWQICHGGQKIPMPDRASGLQVDNITPLTVETLDHVEWRVPASICVSWAARGPGLLVSYSILVSTAPRGLLGTLTTG